MSDLDAVVVAGPPEVLAAVPPDPGGVVLVPPADVTLVVRPDGAVGLAVAPVAAVALATPASEPVALAATPPALVEFLTALIPGPRGHPGLNNGQGYTALADAPVSGHRVVIRTATGVAYADPANAGHAGRTLGLTLNAADAGDTVTVVGYGEVEEPSWAWDTTRPVFLGPAGTLTQVPPVAPAAAWAVTLAYATTPTTLFFDPLDPALLT